MGHRSIVDKSSAYGAKGPGFKPQWRQEFINIKCMFCSFEKIKLRLGPTFKKKKKKGENEGRIKLTISIQCPVFGLIRNLGFCYSDNHCLAYRLHCELILRWFDSDHGNGI